jgi:hypothetical protein
MQLVLGWAEPGLVEVRAPTRLPKTQHDKTLDPGAQNRSARTAYPRQYPRHSAEPGSPRSRALTRAFDDPQDVIPRSSRLRAPERVISATDLLAAESRHAPGLFRRLINHSGKTATLPSFSLKNVQAQGHPARPIRAVEQESLFCPQPTAPAPSRDTDSDPELTNSAQTASRSEAADCGVG